MNKYRKSKEISYIADVMSVVIILMMIFGPIVMIPSVIITFIIFIMTEVITTNNIIMKKLENRKKKELNKEKEEHKLKWKTFTPITPILMIVTGTIYLLYTSLMYLSQIKFKINMGKNMKRLKENTGFTGVDISIAIIIVIITIGIVTAMSTRISNQVREMEIDTVLTGKLNSEINDIRKRIRNGEILSRKD